MPTNNEYIEPPPSNRKRIKRTLPEQYENSIEMLQAIKNQAYSETEMEDEFDYFGKNIASQLRQLPIIDALDIQGEILNLLRIRRQSNLQRLEQASSSRRSAEYFTEPIFDTKQNIIIQEDTN